MFRLGLQTLDYNSISGLSVVAVITQSHIHINAPDQGLGFSPNQRGLCKMLLFAGDDPGADGICYHLQKLLMKPTTLPFTHCLRAAAMKSSKAPCSLRVGRQGSPPVPRWTDSKDSAGCRTLTHTITVLTKAQSSSELALGPCTLFANHTATLKFFHFLLNLSWPLSFSGPHYNKVLTCCKLS